MTTRTNDIYAKAKAKLRAAKEHEKRAAGPHAWTFENSLITTIVSSPGRVAITWADGATQTYISKSFLGLVVITLIARVPEEVLVAVRNAAFLAWPEPVTGTMHPTVTVYGATTVSPKVAR